MNAGKKFFMAGVGIGVFLVLLWLSGFLLFFQSVGRFTAPGSEVHTDAIVVLTGGADRINTGLDLLHAGSAEKLLISGVDQRVTLEKIISLWGGQMDDPGCCVFLGYTARNTKENAAETRKWMEQMYVRSIRLVTSSYHMPRAIAEFRRAMPDIAILPHPVSPGIANEPGWKKPFFLLLVQEYNKTILCRAQTFFTAGYGS